VQANGLPDRVPADAQDHDDRHRPEHITLMRSGAADMKTATHVLDAFENIRRAQRAGVYAPHKQLLILLALARVQRGDARMVEFTSMDEVLKQLLAEFGPSSAAKSRHYRPGTWPPMATAGYGTGAARARS